MTASIISKDRAEQILAPYLEPVGNCLWRAWDMWKGTALPVSIVPRSRANVVYDYAVDEARRMLPPIEGLTVTESRGFVIVPVEDKLLIRFKKFRDGTLQTSGIPTQQQLAFAYQQLTIPGVPLVTQLVAGYMLDELHEDIARVAITCSLGTRVIWAIDIPQADLGVVTTLEPKLSQPREAAVRSTLTRTPDRREQSS